MSKALAERNQIFALYSDPYHIIFATGERPTPGYKVEIEPAREPGFFDLVSELRPGHWPQVISPYACVRGFKIGERQETVYVRHMQGTDKLPVVTVSEQTIPIEVPHHIVAFAAREGSGSVPSPRRPGGSDGGGVPSPTAFSSNSWNDLGADVPFVVYESQLDFGPKRINTSVISTSDEYKLWKGDIDPGFSRKKSDPALDFSREMLIAVGIGEVLLGTSVSVDSIYLFTAGIMGGHAFVHYSVHPPSGIQREIIGAPYTIVKCPVFSGYNVHFLRADSLMYSRSAEYRIAA